MSRKYFGTDGVRGRANSGAMTLGLADWRALLRGDEGAAAADLEASIEVARANDEHRIVVRAASTMATLAFNVSVKAGIDRDGAQQLELPFGAGPDLVAVDRAVDRVRERFGNSALTRGVLVGRHGGVDAGWEVPMLPD